MDIQTVRTIAQVLENHWGTSSSNSGTSSITYDLAGDILTLKYVTVVHFVTGHPLEVQTAEAEREAISLLKAKLKQVKDSFKEATGETLKTEDMGGSSSIELLQAHAERKTSYFRYKHAFKIKE